MTTITEIKRRNAEAGHHFFSEDTMRFFASRVSRTTYGDYFVTSERDTYTDSPRRYTVRWSNPENGHVETVSKFGEYDNLWLALAEAKRRHLGHA